MFNKKQVTLVLHAGDYIAPFALGMMEKHLGCEYRGVFGNNDGERQGLTKLSNGNVATETLELERFNKRIFVIHDIAKAQLDVSTFDIVISGHTHTVSVEKKNTTWFINPGECGGWLRGASTVVTLDLVSDTAKIHRI